jgi:hypothetical protein
MVFNRKDVFRHDFGSEGATPASVAIKSEPVKPEAVKPAALKAAAVKASGAKTVAPKPGDSGQPGGGNASSTLTTAEAIAAELRAAQDALPAPSNATFAPDNLNPANAIPTARRRAGANLAGFKTIAKGLFRS